MAKMKTNERDVLSRTINRKHFLAEEYFEKKYPSQKDREMKNPLITEVLEQITVCEEMFKPVSESLIKDWIDKDSIGYIMRTARTIKFAS